LQNRHPQLPQTQPYLMMLMLKLDAGKTVTPLRMTTSEPDCFSSQFGHQQFEGAKDATTALILN
jgi:hypothetical protein